MTIRSFPFGGKLFSMKKIVKKFLTENKIEKNWNKKKLFFLIFPYEKMREWCCQNRWRFKLFFEILIQIISRSWFHDLIFFENKSFFKSKTVLYVLYFHKKIFLKSQIEIWEYTFQKSINHDSTRSF